MEKVTIAVIGLGPAGLTALKHLREEGFNAVALERRDKIGGVWAYSDHVTYTSAIEGETFTNTSKFVTGFSDFPIPKEYPLFLTTADAAKYFESYASHFNLHQHIRFNTTVRRVARNPSDTAWDVHITTPSGDDILSFDKVVFGHGRDSIPNWPSMPSRDRFKGIVMHAQAYKDPSPFKDKKVLVVGLGNTACETAISISKHGNPKLPVYQSYRRGRVLVSRVRNDGVAFDTRITWPLLQLKYLLDEIAPWLVRPFMAMTMTKEVINAAARSEPVLKGSGDSWAARRKRTERRLREDWRILPSVGMEESFPVVQEDFIPALRRGEIAPVHGFKDFAGERSVLLADGTVLEDVDAVIFCTGYSLDFAMFPDLEFDGACGMPLRTAGEESGNDCKAKPLHIPRLYQMMFPPKWASSIAILSWFSPLESRWSSLELASMALAQIWAAETAKTTPELRKLPKAPNYRPPAILPSLDEMNAQIDAYHAWARKDRERGYPTREGFMQVYPFYRFLHNAAGTAMYENLDHFFTGRGWALWWRDPELWRWLAKGPLNNYGYRLFDTNPEGIPGCGRRIWHGARQAVEDCYEECKEYQREAEAKAKGD